MARIPQVLSGIDRELFSATCGCGDRLYWAWKFVDFPGARFQEYVFTIAWLYTNDEADSRWKGNRELLRILESGLAYWSAIQYGDGSFDEAYPQEHSFAATAFTLFYAVEAVGRTASWLSPATRRRALDTMRRAGDWLCRRGEHHAVLTNHLAAAAAGLWNLAGLVGKERYRARAQSLLDHILARQSAEGWYEEYGGADPGYQTHGSFYLAHLWKQSGDQRLLDSLRSANRFLTHFVHPDGTLGGEYASRNTAFFFPAAYEMLADVCPAAAAIRAQQSQRIAEGRTIGLEQMDPQNLLPMLNNYLFAHEAAQRRAAPLAPAPLAWQAKGQWIFPQAGLLVRSTDRYYAVVGCRKGGVVRAWDKRSQTLAFQSCGYVARIGRACFSNQAQGASDFEVESDAVRVVAPFVEVRQKIFTPWMFVGFRIVSLVLGRIPALARGLKNLLVKALVLKQRRAPMVLTRRVEFAEDSLRILDEVSPPDCPLEHLDKFCTVHMGSSRYAAAEEEQIRGQGYCCAKSEADARGLLKRVEVLLP